VEKRAVSVTEPRGDEVTVSDGFKGGKRLVVEETDKLDDGIRITEAKQ